MLDHSIKLTWAILCTTGTICTWPVLWALARVTNCWWIPMTWGSALSVTVFAFDLGLIWDLNPYEFPVSFCLAQMSILNTSIMVLCGTTTVWYYAALSAAVWPSKTECALRWRPAYAWLVFGLPIVSTALQMGFTVQHAAYTQLGHDGTYCDVTGPMWSKLFGYGVIPLMLAIAGVIYTALSISRLKRIMGTKDILRSRLKIETRSQRTSVISPARLTGLSHGFDPLSSAASSPGLGSSSPADAMDYMSARGECKPVQPPPKLELLPSETTSPVDDKFGIDFDFNSAHTESKSEKSQYELLDIESRSTSMVENRRDIASEESSRALTSSPIPPRNHITLMCQIWRLLLFLFCFFVICLLLALPTWMSLIGHQEPTELATDDIACILISWVIVGIFGHSPAVLRVLFHTGAPPPRQTHLLPF